MCGIFGFIGKDLHSASEILDGLKTLEYRGYDSWGIAVKNNNLLEIEKHTGKIGEARTTLKKTTAGIGHTRWATHGGVTTVNAHPHLDCTKKLAIVHNGIVENYEQLKDQLVKKGHKFFSETDTEVIVHLIEEFQKKEDFVNSVADTFLKLRGLNAFVVVNANENRIIAAKNGSPLIVGYDKACYFITSDISALPQNVTNISVLGDNQMAVLDDEVRFVSPETKKTLVFKMESVERIADTNSKGKYKHFLIKEINEQPLILSNLYSLEKNSIKRLALDVHSAFGTFMLGCGTASYAAMTGEYFLSTIAKKHVNFSVGSEFKYLQHFITKKSLIIPVSQSGETIDIVEPVRSAKKKGAKVISIINVPTSTLARISDYHLLLHAGVERAVVGTKSFTSMVGLLLLVSYTIAGKINEGEKLLLDTSKDVKSILSEKNLVIIKNLAKQFKNTSRVFTIGRGISYVAALEAALKLKETSLIHAEGFAGGELKHGVIALIEKGTPCIVFAPNDETYPEIVSNAAEIKARGGLIIGVGPKNSAVFDIFLETADLKEATLISQTVYMQLLSYYLALERNIEDPDKPRNLAKSVTVK